MDTSFLHNADASLLTLVLFIGMIFMVRLGMFVGNRLHAAATEIKESEGTVLTALFAMFGFILAFTFNMSGNRYDNTRNIFIEESNSISTALLRADLYPDSIRNALRADFKDYLEARIYYYDHFRDPEKVNLAKDSATKAGRGLWTKVMSQSKQPGMVIPTYLMVPALNALFDIANSREGITMARVPDPLIYMLFILALVTSFIIGFSTPQVQKGDWVIIIGFIALSCMIVYITLDLGRPLRGLIRAEIGENAILELRNLFK